MDNNATKTSFDYEAKEKFVVLSISIILSFIFIIVSILPQYCSLFSNNIPNGFLCDGISSNNLPCPICEDTRMAIVSSFLCGLGLCFLFLPFVVSKLRKLRNHPVQPTKLFD